MAAATIATQELGLVMGNKRVSHATLSNVIATNTWDAAMARIDHVNVQLVDLAPGASAGQVETTISNGTVTFSLDGGTIASLFVSAVGN
jgi:hypothetical protein